MKSDEGNHFILKCGGKKDQHVESKGKLYGISPIAHCDTNCPYEKGTCHTSCLTLSIAKRPCLQEDYESSI